MAKLLGLCLSDAVLDFGMDGAPDEGFTSEEVDEIIQLQEACQQYAELTGA